MVQAVVPDAEVDRVLGVPAAARRHLEGKYLQTPDVPAGMEAWCSLGELASAFGDELKDLVKGKITTISGQPALQLVDKRHSTSAYVDGAGRLDCCSAVAWSPGGCGGASWPNNPLGRRRVDREQMGRADGAPDNLAAAIRAYAVQDVLRAVAAPGALVRAD